MKKLFLLALGLGIVIAVERRAGRLGIGPKAVVLGALQNWRNRLGGTQPRPEAE